MIFLLTSSIDDILYRFTFQMMPKMRFMSSLFLNRVSITEGSRNFEPYSSGLPCWYSISLNIFLLNMEKMLLLCYTSSCVHSKDRNGDMSSLIFLLRILLVVVTIHDVCDFSFCFSLNFILDMVQTRENPIFLHRISFE